jgi:hypothetical protein
MALGGCAGANAAVDVPCVAAATVKALLTRQLI